MADSVEVSYDPNFKASSASRTRLCAGCGQELEDKRMKYHPQCKPVDDNSPTTTIKSGGRVRGKGKTRVTDATHKGMTSIVGKLLYLITLYIAWNQLRQIGVPDHSGDIADTLALTDDEAEIIGKPLARLFLNTEGGRKLAPALVENEDTIDAAFAFWDWYRRSTNTLDEYKRQYIPATVHPVERPPTPRKQTPRHAARERSASNGNTGPLTGNRGQSEGDPSDWESATYVPPSPIDLLGGL